jgi:2-polyprenyl-3-methyl-5-hydroxy-6-metoxy-1,4-benzoquinol methylase
VLLQERGVDVTGLDLVPEAVEIMRRRGLRDAVCADIFTYELARDAAPFDSILLMMDGTVVIENLERLELFLRQLGKLVKPDGQVLLSSTDARLMKNPEEGARQAAARLAGKYIGEMRWQMEYAGTKGDEFTGLLVDPETLAAAAARTGWNAEVLGIMAEGFFLARLVPRARD